MNAMDSVKSKREAINNKIKETNQVITDLKERLALSKSEANELNTLWKNTTGHKGLEVARNQVKTLENALSRANRFSKELTTAFHDLKDVIDERASATLEADIAAEEFTETINRQISVFGKTEREIKSLEIQYGKASQAAKIRAAIAAKTLDRLEEERKKEEELQKVNRS